MSTTNDGNFPDIIGQTMPSQQQFQTDLNAQINPVIDEVFPILIALFGVSILIRGLIK